MNIRHPKRQKRLVIFLSTVVTILFVFAVLQQTQNLSPYFGAPDRSTVLLLWALTSLDVILLVICTLILLRNLLKLYFERRSHQLGSKFRTKLVFAFIGLTIIPTVFMALFAYTLIHRNLDKWFSTPIDQVVNNVGLIVQEISQDARIHASRRARFLASHSAVRGLATPAEGSLNEIKSLAADYNIPLLLFFDGSRRLTGIYQTGEVYAPGQPQFQRIGGRLKLVAWNAQQGQMTEQAFNRLINNAGKKDITLDATDETGQAMVLAGAAVETGGFEAPCSIVIGYKIPGNLLKLASEIFQSSEDYKVLAKDRPLVRDNLMLQMGLITILIVFSAVWIGLYISKRIAIPIRALAEASNEVSKGNLRVQVDCQAQDELEILVNSFNRMTSQLYESSEKLERTNQDLHSSNQALEERRRYTEAVLQNIPTGVISITADQKISRVNKAAQRMLQCDLEVINRGIEALFHARDLMEIQALIEQASKTASATRDFRLHLKDRTLYCAVTLSALDSESPSSQGCVMVLEDLTELLKAQKANAWREVARRLAHEIKNPLTPIQLSADRLLRNYFQKPAELSATKPAGKGFETVLRECVQTIHHEVASLKGMVDEFSRFARLPVATMVSTNVNLLIEQTLASYNGRLDGVQLDASLAPELPAIKVDPEQLKRVFVNLIDNALEALEDASEKGLSVTSSFYPNRQTVEVVVRDTGHGISSADKEKLFLPYFSTKRRGTGLGLAIASRIIADHKGYIHVEDNIPVGASFVVEIPAL
ncbi:MAG: HAMP domain-containing protein [Acidobacteria bacterium]|nr:HAMP domain-containing protein [Acidobacteriota bacterium]